MLVYVYIVKQTCYHFTLNMKMTVVQTALGYQAGHLKKNTVILSLTEVYIEIPKLYWLYYLPAYELDEISSNISNN